MNSTGSDRLRQIHERRLANLYEDYEAAVGQQDQVLDAVSANRLRRQAEAILAEIEALEGKVAGLEPEPGKTEGTVPSVVPALILLLTTRFSEDELQGLALAVGVEYEVLPAVGKENKARELVMYAFRRERLGLLVEKGRQRRPDIDWEPYGPD